VTFVLIQFLERNGPLINFAEDGLFAGYLKEGQGLNNDEEDDDSEKENLGVSQTEKEEQAAPQQ
jgi:hypothetical protein